MLAVAVKIWDPSCLRTQYEGIKKKPVHRVRLSGDKFILKISTILDFWYKQLFTNVVMLSKACSKVPIPLKKSLEFTP